MLFKLPPTNSIDVGSTTNDRNLGIRGLMEYEHFFQFFHASHC